MDLPHDATVLSAVCDCGISWSFTLFLVGPTFPMLHTKSQGHRPSGSGVFQRVFTIYIGVAA